MHRPFLALLACIAAPAHAEPLDVETVMADPDWIGAPVESPYWSSDGRSIWYRLKREGGAARDLYRADPASGRGAKVDIAASDAEGPPVFSRDRRQAAFCLDDAAYLKTVGQSRRKQVARLPVHECTLQFSADGRALDYRQGLDWYRYDIAAGTVAPLAVIKSGGEGEAAPTALRERQAEWFKTFGRRGNGQAPPLFRLRDDRVATDTSLSPNGRWLLVVTAAKGAPAGRVPQIMHYVTESGYPETENVRPNAGRDAIVAHGLVLVDLREGSLRTLATDALPGIHDDPLGDIRARTIAALKAAGKTDRADALAAPATRAVTIDTRGDYGGGGGIAWSDDGENAAVQLRAVDHKDRWIATVDVDKAALVPQHRLSDPAWINWHYNDFGWYRDGRALWFLSEESGYVQLHAKPLAGMVRALTKGTFEATRPVRSADGRWFYLRANVVAPYSYDVYRVPADGGELARVSAYEGMDDFALSPDGLRIAVLHSSSYLLPQLAVLPASGGKPRELTDTTKPAFKAHDWIAPRIVTIPSAQGAGTIHAKFYAPPGVAAARPAVIFLHGGDIQNTSRSWPPYFREQLFHNVLARQGYAVLDIDFRVTSGYGRAWRVAAYRDPGKAGLEDVLDGKAWLVKEQGVDPRRVGLYGGSMGGFMTLTALLRAPGEFAAGAALRPLVDWSTYNEHISSSLLNDPEIDPEAYRASSPIEYADRLQDALLIAHGMIDDNVLAGDALRLYQRFIELRKKNFWFAPYPLERHSFTSAEAWYDEYRRIEELFRTWLKP